MSALAPLAVAIPLLMAALLTATGSIGLRRLRDTAAILTALAVAVFCEFLLIGSLDTRIVYWFGGWQPRGGAAIGIAFAIDPLGAGIALLAAALTTVSLVYSWWYFDTIGTLFSTLMLAFLGGMVGFAFTGDLFNMFVFFELMGAAAYALTGYKIEEEPALMGAFSFAVTNTIGAFMVLVGLGLLYGRTGALNLAQIGRTLDAGPADGLVVAAFVLITCGFGVKAAIVPLHFWLDDAHAVAPTPVCVLFSGVMVELGLYAIARVYWTTFAGVFESNRELLRGLGIGAGAVTVLVGGIMAFCQSHLKRLLAFSTISHVGMFLLGLAMFSPLALAGASLEIIGHGLIKGSLFLGAGVLLNRFESVDAEKLHGRGKRLPILAILMTIAALALCGLPFLGLDVGEAVVAQAAERLGYSVISWVMLCGSILTGGAVLWAVAKIFLGLGARRIADGKTPSHEQKEVEEKLPNSPLVMLVPIAALLAIAIGIGAAASAKRVARAGAQVFVDHAGYADAVLDGTHLPTPPLAAVLEVEAQGRWPAIRHGVVATFGAVVLAVIALFPGYIPRKVRQTGNRLFGPGLRRLRALHSGHVGDYVTWLLFGVALLGGLLVLFRRG